MNTTTELSTIDTNEIATIMQGAGAILNYNEKLAQMAEAGGQTLLDTIEAEGMSDDIDADLNTWQVKAKNALIKLNEKRSPITQIMTKMAKVFTELEGRIDPKKETSIYNKIQLKRNDWAKQKAKIAKDKEDAILLKQNTENEKINLTAEIQTQIKEIYGNKLFAFKKFVTETYNSLTLENVAEIKAKINEAKINYPLEAFNKIEPTVFAKFLKEAEVSDLITEERSKLYDECSANFREVIEAHKLETLDLFPSRINELKAISKSSATEKKRLEDEAEKRRLAEEKKAKDDAEAQKLADQQKIEENKKLATAGNLFNSTAALQQVKEESAKVRLGYKIDVINTDGIGALFMFYFEKEGRGLTVEALLKKDLTQMKTFAEKHAHKTGEKIVSKHLIYEEAFKAVATK